MEHVLCQALCYTLYMYCDIQSSQESDEIGSVMILILYIRKVM